MSRMLLGKKRLGTTECKLCNATDEDIYKLFKEMMNLIEVCIVVDNGRPGAALEKWSGGILPGQHLCPISFFSWLPLARCKYPLFHDESFCWCAHMSTYLRKKSQSIISLTLELGEDNWICNSERVDTKGNNDYAAASISVISLSDICLPLQLKYKELAMLCFIKDVPLDSSSLEVTVKLLL